ncbi:BLUF domain-containing protein [Hymenobacter sediminicola]|uniref:BLUF domain-containing protein n=1 Tax=Hymenobacter sediminicola TaxID=2761579 RepID=A0A7G7W3V7_9BACT|nr:BLUF domain-containing protein [Hymenobacter sediminicola]QNH61050.1 BLUF domain-containing protein [Hymenobacter sediminicola]
MHHIVYQSYAVGHPTNAELKHLLQQSRSNNSRLSITGLLLYGNGSFLQVLEGTEDAVREIYGRIVIDQRHTRVLKLSDGPIEARVFSNWSMGFQVLSGDDFARLTGYIDPYRSNFLDAHLPEIEESMLLLLKSFVVNDDARL